MLDKCAVMKIKSLKGESEINNRVIFTQSNKQLTSRCISARSLKKYIFVYKCYVNELTIYQNSQIITGTFKTTKYIQVEIYYDSDEHFSKIMISTELYLICTEKSISVSIYFRAIFAYICTSCDAN